MLTFYQQYVSANLNEFLRVESFSSALQELNSKGDEGERKNFLNRFCELRLEA